MKFSLKLPTRKKAPRTKGRDNGKNLTSVALAAFIATAFVLAAAAFVLYFLFAHQVQRGREEQVEIVADGFANRIGELMAQHTATMDLLVKDPALDALFAAADAQGLRDKEAEWSYLFPSSVRVRLLRPGIEEIDISTSPQLGYACLDLLRQAETKDAEPEIEVHSFGEPQQHIDLVRRVLSPTGRRLIGNLLVSFPVSILQQSLDKIGAAHGYIELRQETSGAKSLTLAARGNADLKGAPPLRTVPIAGTHWSLAYWPGDASGTLDIAGQFIFLGVLIGGALVIALVMWLLARTYSGALRADLVTVINVFKDVADGRLRREYPVQTSECKGTIELLARMAREFGGTPAPAPSNAANESATHVADDPATGAGLLYQGDALDVGVVEEPPVAVDPTIFKAYDIRGIVGKSLTTEVAFHIGRSIGSEAAERDQQAVIVARDGRLSGPDLVEALSNGLRAAGMDVIDIGRVPTPVLYFATHYLSTSSGVMLTGSHNPPDYNGMKIMLRGETLSGDTIQALRNRIETGKFASGEGGRQVVDIAGDYIDRIVSDVRLARPLKVVVDCGNGVAGELAPRLLRELGCDVIELYCEIDGNFPHHHPDPSRPENVRDLIAAVQDRGADLGLAFDGDGDRLGVIAPSGKIIWPDRVMMLLAMDVLSRQPGADIIFDVKCSRHLERVIAGHGGRPLMWKTGHSLIKAKMKETGALLAGEMSGHIFFKERWFGFDDALYSAARLLEVLAMDARSTEKVFDSLPDSVNTPELNVQMAEREHHRFMQRLLSQARFEDARVSTIDGLRVDFKDGWGLVRASNTTPCLVLRFEADNAGALERIQGQFSKLLLEIDPALSLPF